MDMEREILESFDSPESTLIERASYNRQSEVLDITMRTTGKVYTTSGFTNRLWDEFATSQSKGGFFNRYIRTMYLMKPKD